MKKEIILESKFTAHQKTHVSIILGLPILVVIIKFLSMEFGDDGITGNYDGITDAPNNYMKIAALILVFFVIVMLSFLKTGVLKKNNQLYLGTYIFGKLLFNEKVDLGNKTKLAILKLTKNQKMAWFNIANPDQGISYHKNDITLLNDKHTQKTLLVSLDDENLANETVSFLEEHFDLTLETYSPDFS
ncbi:hypothetical protein [Tenacibaculum sp. 190524A05c]|uniref:hypothetical protein n=1 Tax=Tenacibaculum platacis TaxID=3137852 RepID=UPI0032B1C68C